MSNKSKRNRAGGSSRSDSKTVDGILNAYGRVGWWHADEHGWSLQPAPTGLLWGDEPADIMDEALDKISAAFKAEWGRTPTRDELVSGVLFSCLNGIG